MFPNLWVLKGLLHFNNNKNHIDISIIDQSVVHIWLFHAISFFWFLFLLQKIVIWFKFEKIKNKLPNFALHSFIQLKALVAIGWETLFYVEAYKNISWSAKTGTQYHSTVLWTSNLMKNTVALVALTGGEETHCQGLLRPASLWSSSLTTHCHVSLSIIDASLTSCVSLYPPRTSKTNNKGARAEARGPQLAAAKSMFTADTTAAAARSPSAILSGVTFIYKII